MKTLKITTFLMILLFASGCTTSNNGPISIDHAECLQTFSIREFYIKSPDGHEASFDDCEEKWEWKTRRGWNICKEEGFSYKIEYSEGNRYVINSIYNSSGSGIFTHLFLIEMKDDAITLVRSIGGGDRCQKGLVTDEVRVDGDYVHYSELLTPHSLISWDGRRVSYTSYDSCSECCCAAANYKFNLKTSQTEFVSVELLRSRVSGDNQFSRTYNSYIQNGKKILKESEILEFIKKVDG